MRTQSYHLQLAHTAPDCSVLSFSTSETLNDTYRLIINLTSTDSALPLSSYIGQRATFDIRPSSSDALSFIHGMLPPDALKVWNGIITSCERLSESADQTHYRLVLEPKLAALKHHIGSRLFQHQSVPEIIQSLLQHRGFNGVQYRIQTTRSYPVREYVTQYQESDFAFLCRLCEEEGIWFTFEQHPEYGEVVLFGDSTAHYLRSNRLPTAYRPHAGLEAVGSEAVFSLNIRHNPILQSIRVTDYNYRSADTDLADELRQTAPEAIGSVSHWGLHHKTPEEAQLQTALLRELDECRRIEAAGEGNDTAFQPGQVFHTDRSFAEAPDGWLILSMNHSGSRDTAYQNHFTAIPADKVFRPARTTPCPNIRGSLPARITSPDNFTYAYIDSMGRYRVRLPFDFDEWSPGGESRPVRLAKPYAGPAYGQHFPLHKDTEVMLSFVQGHPDRPYISGVMHNSVRPDHVPANWNSRNVIRTWANNKLRMEDKRGEEHIKLATDYGKSQLNLGHIVDGGRKKRGENGEGFELRTDSWGAIRAGKGLFLSSDGQSGAAGNVLDMDAAISQLEQALSLAKSLNKAAQTTKNEATETQEQEGRLKNGIRDLQEAVILLSAPEGIASTTPRSQLHTAGEHLHFVSGGHTAVGAGQNFTAHAVNSVNLFAQTAGMKMQANQGKVSIQAQNDEMQLNALEDVTVSSSNGKVTVAAKEEILITCQGAYIRLADGEVEIGTPKIIRFRGPIEGTGNKQWPFKFPEFTMRQNDFELFYHDSNLMPIGNAPYRVVLENGQEFTGRLDKNGKAVLKDINAAAANVYFGYSEDKVKLPDSDIFDTDYSHQAVLRQLDEMGMETEETDIDRLADLLLSADLDYAEE